MEKALAASRMTPRKTLGALCFLLFSSGFMIPSQALPAESQGLVDGDQRSELTPTGVVGAAEAPPTLAADTCRAKVLYTFDSESQWIFLQGSRMSTVDEFREALRKACFVEDKSAALRLHYIFSHSFEKKKNEKAAVGNALTIASPILSLLGIPFGAPAMAGAGIGMSSGAASTVEVVETYGLKIQLFSGSDRVLMVDDEMNIGHSTANSTITSRRTLNEKVMKALMAKVAQEAAAQLKVRQ